MTFCENQYANLVKRVQDGFLITKLIPMGVGEKK